MFRYASNCEKNVKSGFENEKEKHGSNSECADPDDDFEGLLLVEDETTGKMISV